MKAFAGEGIHMERQSTTGAHNGFRHLGHSSGGIDQCCSFPDNTSHRQNDAGQNSRYPPPGRTIRKMVRSRPAPRPKLASRYVSGTDFKASSVVRMIKGKIIMDKVAAPAIREYPIPNKLRRTTDRTDRKQWRESRTRSRL